MNSPSYIWACLLRHLDEQFPNTVDTYFADAELVALTDEYLILQVPTSEGRQAIRRQFAGPIEEALQTLFRRSARLVLPDEDQLWAFRQRESKPEPVTFPPECTFDTFFAGPENQMAVKLARAAAADPGAPLYNPLYLYGPAGVGKTHLLMAIANRIRADLPEKRILYIRGDQFLNELIDAIRQGRQYTFKRRIRETDVLLLDGISTLGGREAAQEELYHILSDLQRRQKMIVLTAAQKPSELVSFEERLIDRFSGGIVTAVSPPGLETRLTVIREKARLLRLELDEETVQYLACSLTDSVRQIEGALKKLRVYRDLQGVPMDLPHVAQTVEL